MKITKKILGIAVILGITAIGFTNAYTNVPCGSERFGQLECALIEPAEMVVMGNYTNALQNYWNFYNREQKNIFEIKTDNYKDTIFWSGHTLINMQEYNGIFNQMTQYNFVHVCEYGGTDYTGAISYCNNEDNYNLTVEDFITDYKGKNINKYLTYNDDLGVSFQNGLVICSIYNTNTVCIMAHYTNSSTNEGKVRERIMYTQDYGSNYIEENYNITASPLIGQNSGGGGGTTTSGQLYCPPIKHEITMYGYKYNTGLCYSNTEEISGGQVITVTPISIFDAFPTYQAYVQAYNLVTNNCHTSTVNTVEQCQTALQTIGKKPSQILLKLINSDIQEGVSLSKIYQYCHLQLDFTEEEKRNLSTCDLKEEETYYATGVNGNTNSNPNPLQGYTDILQETDTILTPEDGSIFDAILPDGVLTWKDVIFNANFMSHFATLYTKITLMFRARPYQDGILPPVITSLLLLIILFKVYKK